MPIPTEGYPLAAAVSPRFQVIDTVPSTNAKLLHDAEVTADEHPHLSVLMTRDQRAGRGRLDRSWTAPAGTAVAVSVLLRVGAVAASDRGWIPLIAGAAMTRAVAAQLSGHDVVLKWPNDVLVDGQKICGILAEVVPSDPQVVIVGAGVNTTMTAVDLPVTTATSFAALGREADEDRLLADYLTFLRDDIATLAVHGGATVLPAITALCATIGREVVASLPGDTVLRGVADRLDAQGRLVITGDGGEHVVSAGDIVHVR